MYRRMHPGTGRKKWGPLCSFLLLIMLHMYGWLSFYVCVVSLSLSPFLISLLCSLFVSAQHEIYKLMLHDTFPPFLSSPEYRTYFEELSNQANEASTAEAAAVAAATAATTPSKWSNLFSNTSSSSSSNSSDLTAAANNGGSGGGGSSDGGAIFQLPPVGTHVAAVRSGKRGMSLSYMDSQGLRRTSIMVDSSMHNNGGHSSNAKGARSLQRAASHQRLGTGREGRQSVSPSPSRSTTLQQLQTISARSPSPSIN